MGRVCPESSYPRSPSGHPVVIQWSVNGHPKVRCLVMVSVAVFYPMLQSETITKVGRVDIDVGKGVERPPG